MGKDLGSVICLRGAGSRPGVPCGSRSPLAPGPASRAGPPFRANASSRLPVGLTDVNSPIVLAR